MWLYAIVCVPVCEAVLIRRASLCACACTWPAVCVCAVVCGGEHAVSVPAPNLRRRVSRVTVACTGRCGSYMDGRLTVGSHVKLASRHRAKFGVLAPSQVGVVVRDDKTDDKPYHVRRADASMWWYNGKDLELADGVRVP